MNMSRWQRASMAMLFAGVALVAIPSATFAQPSATSANFDVPAQDLGAALNEVARQSNREIYFAADLTRGKRAARLQGNMSLGDALTKLLAGTGLSFRINRDGTIVIQADTSTNDEEGLAADDEEENVVVTGTLLRGVAPQSSASRQMTRKEIEASPATSTDQLLREIPQVTTFNTVSTVGSNMDGAGGAGSSIAVNFTNQTKRPGLRNLTASGGSAGSTLILIDGHRVAGAGIFKPSPDPDIVSPAVLARVEIVLDGGSALYGSDAIAGVINFITVRRVDGIQMDIRPGFADDYWTFDGNVAAGHSWSSGSAYLSYSYAAHDAIEGRDRDYIQAIDWLTGIPTGRQCAVANVAVGSRIYGMPGLVLNQPNTCDLTDYQTIVPKEERHGVFAGLSQELTEWLTFDTRGYYSFRDTEGNAGPLETSVNIRPTNPFYRNLPGGDAGAAQSVQFNYAPVLGNSGGVNLTTLKQWGITPSITADVADGWQMSAFANFSESRTVYRNQAVNTALQQSYVNETSPGSALDPYDIGSASNASLVSEILNWQRFGFARSWLENYRLVGDGTLFELPGGPLKIAAGAEYIRESFRTRSGFTERGEESSLPTSSYARHVTALFGEVNVPLVGEQNDIPAIHALTLSVSGRYDHYSDFGSTTNPKLGVVYEPVDWLRLRASWGKAFNAPSPSDQLASLANSMAVLNRPFVTPPGGAGAPAGAYSIILFGSVPDLQPQKSESLSYGFDVRPPFVPGLTGTLNVYQIEFSNQLGNPPFFNAVEMFTNYPQFVQLFPSADQIAAAGSSTPGGDAAVAQFLSPGGPQVYEIVDARARNLGRTKVRGLDFAVRYDRETSFGSIDLGFSGNYQLSRKFSNAPTGPLADVDLDLTNRLRFSANAGASIGALRAQAVWNHLQGYDIVPSASIHQSEVSSFNTVDLFLKYDIPAPALAKELSVTLNVGNLFDQDPPTLMQDGTTGITNGSTLGRLIQFGIHAKY